MTGGRDPWADPSTPTEPGAPYAGPPVTAPPAYGPPAGPYPGYGPYGGHPGYPPPWPVVPRGPRRPGQVIASAVLAFVQGALVLIASVYVYFFASIIAIATANAPVDLDAEGLATEGTVLAVVQLLSAILLITAGVLALNRRTRGTWLTLAAAHALQILLSIYWWARLVVLTGDIPDADIDGAFLGFPLFFAAGPAVGLGLVMAGAARRWFEDTPQR